MEPKSGFDLWNFWLTRVVLAIVLTIGIRLIVAILDGAGLPIIVTRAIGCLIGIAVMLGLGRINWLQPSTNGLMPVQPARGLLYGALAGIILYSGIVLVAFIAGWYAIRTVSFDAGALAGAFGLLVFAAAFEEILFRGVLFQMLEKSIGTGWALALSGMLFGVLHLGNTNATLIGAVAVGLAGVALGALFAWTRDLWLLTGVHVMWNFMQGPIFGVAVSGNSFQGFIQPRIQGAEIFTGGAFGFEAGIITIVLCLVSSFWLIQRTQKTALWQ